jgi:nitrogen fixation NifU-like protein
MPPSKASFPSSANSTPAAAADIEKLKFEGKLSEKRTPEPGVETISHLFLLHAQDPLNMGELESANGLAVGVGSCGDTLAVQLQVADGVIEDIKCLPRGCLYTVVCASVMSEMAKGKDLADALTIQPEDIDSLLGGLPPDHMHCARLAVNSLGEAIDDYYRRNGFPENPENDATGI